MAQTAARLDLSVWRNDDLYEFPIRVRGVDLTFATMTMHIRLRRDTPGLPLVALAKVTNGNAEGLRVAGVAQEDGVPVTDLRVRLNKSTRQALPYAGEIGDDTVLEYALVWGGRTRLFGQVRMLAHAYDSDAAPSGRSADAGYAQSSTAPFANATLTVSPDGAATVTIDGTEALAPLVSAASAQADRAGQLAQAASEASATAAQARDAILDIIDGALIFDTKADATAALAAIPAGGLVQVLKDETRQQHWTVYRKVGTALAFILDRNAGAHVQLEQFGAVADCDPATGTGTPADAAFEAAIAALYLAGGGELRLVGRYRLTKAFLLPNDSTQTEIGTQPAIRIVGQGCSMNGGKGPRWLARTILYWTGEAGEAVAKIDTRGIGSLTISDLDFGASAAATSKPFVRTTFTTPLVTRCGFVTPQTGPDCQQDVFIFGGTVDFETQPDFDRRSPDCGFQGYGAAVTHCFFNGIRRAAHFGRYANDIMFSFNNIWGACGNASGTGAAITADGGDTYSVGKNVIGNLFEMHAYKSAIDIEWASAWKIWGNSAYDASGEYTETVVRIGANCAANISVITGLNNPRAPGDIYRRYLDDPHGKVSAFISSYGEEPSYLRGLSAGEDTSPNRFGSTRFDAPGAAPVIYQSRQAEVPGAPARMMVRVTFNPLAPSGDDIIDIVMHGGGRQIGGGEAGNVYNWAAAGASRGASWWDSGRSWGFNRGDAVAARREGASMGVDTGVGGSFWTVWAVQHRIRDHTGKLGATFYPNTGTLDMASGYLVAGKVVLGEQQPAIANDKTTDEKVALILAAMRAHGLIAS